MLQLVEKVSISVNRTNSLSLTPNPFPSGRGLLSGAAAPATLLGASPQTPFIFTKRFFLQSERGLSPSVYDFCLSFYVLIPTFAVIVFF